MSKPSKGRVFLRGNIWWVEYHGYGQKYRESSNSSNKKEAEGLLANRLAQISLGQHRIIAKRPRIKTLIPLIRTDYIINQRKSLPRVDQAIDHLEPFFGNQYYDNINSLVINSYIEKRMKEKAAPGTINRELTVLRRILNLAKEAGQINNVPTIKLLKENNVRRGFLEHEDFRIIHDNLPGSLQPLFILAYYTGMRRGELLNLTWSRVNLKEGYLRLEATDTKTNEARTIYLPPECTQALKKAFGKRVLGCDLVFHENGNRLSDFRTPWSDACKAAGKPGLLFHDLRRTAIRNLIRAGVPERVAMQVSGHRSRSVFDRYNIVSDRDLREAAEKLETYLKLNRREGR